jgi:hypothetical protein
VRDASGKRIRMDSTKESRRDSTFLRCMSNCRAKCLEPRVDKIEVDCSQDCQDQCCTSYEQCSFKLEP